MNSKISWLLGSNLLHNMCRRHNNQLMLIGMYPLLELVETLALLDLNLPRHDGLAAVDLLDDIVHHDTRLVALELAGPEVIVGALDGVGAVVFAWQCPR